MRQLCIFLANVTSNKNFTGTLAVIFLFSVNFLAKLTTMTRKQCTKLYQTSNKFKIQLIKYIITCNKTLDKGANFQGNISLQLSVPVSWRAPMISFVLSGFSFFGKVSLLRCSGIALK